MAVVKLNVIGQAYTLRSLAAGAQTSYNLYAERIQDPAEQEKNKAFYYGRPGYHSFANTGGAAVRGIWTGAGRCFIAWDAHYAEFNSSGTQVGPTRNISNASAYGLANSPVQFFPNGNQLFIVSGGVAYVDNGAGPVQVTLNNSSGTVVAGGGSGNEVIWQSGDKFPTDGSWTGLTTFMINGHANTVFHVLSDELLLLTATASDSGVQPYSVAGAAVVGVTGAFLDNTFFTNVAFTRMIQFGSVNDSTGPFWNALDSITKDSWPDNVLGILADASQLYLWGTDSFEVWTANPSPTTNDFFVRIDGASGRVGNSSAWGPVSLDGRVYFLGRNSQGGISAYVMNGFTPVRISMHAQEQAWQAASLGTNAISWTITFEGHSFLVIYFGGVQTWAFDTTTGGWDRWVTGTGLNAFPFAYHSYIPEFGTGGMHLIGGPSSGIVYNMNPAFYDDAGSDIWWQRALPHQYNARMRMYDSRLEVEMETGTAPSGTPTIALDYSDDRGHTFGTAESQSLGTTGAFSQRVYWTALGSYYDRVYRISGQGQGRVCIIDIELDQDTGVV